MKVSLLITLNRSPFGSPSISPYGRPAVKASENPIINNPTFRSLTVNAQWLFFAALDEGPRRCGIVDIWPKRIAKVSAGATEENVVLGAKELDSKGVAYFDETTDELLFPGYLTEVTNVNNPRMMIAAVNSVAGVASHKLVGMVVHELQQLREQNPDAKAWADPRVAELMARPTVTPAVMAGDQ